MLPMKLDLTEELASTLRQLRLDHPVNGKILTAENLSKAIGNNRAWMSQIESRRLKKIKREDIIKIYQLLFNLPTEEKAEDKAELDLLKFLNLSRTNSKYLIGSNINLEDIKYDKSKTDKDENAANKKALKKMTTMYIKDCKELYHTLVDDYLYELDESTRPHMLLWLCRLNRILFDDSYNALKIYQSIPCDLYKYADENERHLIDSKLDDLIHELNKLQYKKLLTDFEKIVKIINNDIGDVSFNINKDNDSIVMWLYNLSNILFNDTPITLIDKIKYTNMYISLLNNYGERTNQPFLLDILSNSATMLDIKNSVDYMQSFINTYINSSTYLLNHLSSKYNESDQ